MNKFIKSLRVDNLQAFFLVSGLFFLWAIPNNLNDILIPQFMKSFELSRFQAGLTQSAFYLGYFMLAIPAAILMERTSYKFGIITGLLLFALGCLMFLPAAYIGQYWVFLLALFVIASGLAFLETCANSFIVVTGDSAGSEYRLNFAQSFNPVGAIFGVLVGTFFIFSGSELSENEITQLKDSGTYSNYLTSEVLRVFPPYLMLAIVLVVWALAIGRTTFPAEKVPPHNTNFSWRRIKGLLAKKPFALGVLAQFLYVGAQVGTWSYLISYAKAYTGKTEREAGVLLTASLIAFCAGRLTSTAAMRFISAEKLLGLFSLINIALLFNAVVNIENTGIWSLIASSFFMSLMFPTIFALSLKGLGSESKLGGSLIIMSIIGGAVWTPLMGFIADTTGSLSSSMLLPMISYAYILYYSIAASEESKKDIDPIALESE